MKTLQHICEGVLNSPEAQIVDHVELANTLHKELEWCRYPKLKESQAVFYEAALLNVTKDGFIQASHHKLTTEQLRTFLYFIIHAYPEYVCTNEEVEDWEDREYEHGWPLAFSEGEADDAAANPNDKWWAMTTPVCAYRFFWAPEYISSLDQEYLLRSKKCQEYSKKLQDILKKHGVKLKLMV